MSYDHYLEHRAIHQNLRHRTNTSNAPPTLSWQCLICQQKMGNHGQFLKHCKEHRRLGYRGEFPKPRIDYLDEYGDDAVSSEDELFDDRPILSPARKHSRDVYRKRTLTEEMSKPPVWGGGKDTPIANVVNPNDGADEGPNEDGPDEVTRGGHKIIDTYTRTFSNFGFEKTFKVSLGEAVEGHTLDSVDHELRQLFDDVLEKAKTVSDNHLGRVVIESSNFKSGPIVVPLRPIEYLDTDSVLNAIQNVCQSDNNIEIDDSFCVKVGALGLNEAGLGLDTDIVNFLNLNELKQKRSVIPIINDDDLCMARAIAVAWCAGHSQKSYEEWTAMKPAGGLPGDRLFEFMLKHETCPRYFRAHIQNTQRPEQLKFARFIQLKAGVPLNRKCTVLDLAKFATALNVNILVVDAKRHNEIIDHTSTPDKQKRKNIFILLVQIVNTEVGVIRELTLSCHIQHIRLFHNKLLRPLLEAV